MNITEIAKNIKELMWEEADKLGRSSQFIKRERKFSGRSFAQMLVFGSMGEPELSYTDMVQYANLAGTEVSAQGVAARFTKEGAQFLAELLESAVNRVVERVFIDRLMALATSSPLPQVRAITSWKLAEYGDRLAETASGLSEEDSAHFRMLSRDIQRFLDRPQPPLAYPDILSPPPGSPIGDPGMGWVIWWK